MPVRTFKVSFSNNTTLPLFRSDLRLCHGDWTPHLEPPLSIPASTRLEWQSESGFVTGTEGWVKYRLGFPPTVIPDPGGPPPAPVLGDTVYIYWDNPLLDSPFELGDGTMFKCAVSVGDVTPDCDANGDGQGGSGFSGPPSDFDLTKTGFDNAGAAFNDDWLVIPQVPFAPFFVFGNTEIIEHAVAHLTLRKKGSVKQSLPIGYDSRRGLRIFQRDPSVTSIRSIFSL
jgi:hypothetical protein